MGMGEYIPGLFSLNLCLNFPNWHFQAFIDFVLDNETINQPFLFLILIFLFVVIVHTKPQIMFKATMLGPHQF